MERFLAFVGFGFLVGFVVLIVIMTLQAIDAKVDDWKSYKRFKNRMKKPPTAKCYCIDCIYVKKLNNTHLKCANSRLSDDLHVADCHFCCWGERKK